MGRSARRRDGGDAGLLDLEETIRRLKPFSRNYVGMRAIPVDRVVGSEGRTNDFDRGFVPRRREVADRMRRVSAAFPDGAFPPIVVHQLGEAYFVIDGHHRVAVARRKGIDFIDADVTELHTDWPMRADADMGAIIHAEQESWFEETSGLEEAKPDVRIKLSRTADYVELLENVQIHGYHLMLERGRVLPVPEIAADWYERIFAPVEEAIRREEIRAEGSTPGDLFLLLYRRRRDRYAEHRCPPLEETVRTGPDASDPRRRVRWWGREH